MTRLLSEKLQKSTIDHPTTKIIVVVSIVLSAIVWGFPGSTSAAGPINWPSYLLGPRHSSMNQLATAITPANASGLTAAWASRFTPPGHSGRAKPLLYSSPIMYGGRVYIGSFDGWFYELDEATGRCFTRETSEPRTLATITPRLDMGSGRRRPSLPTRVERAPRSYM